MRAHGCAGLTRIFHSILQHIDRVELYPHRRPTEYTHRPIPGAEYQSRRAEHPEIVSIQPLTADEGRAILTSGHRHGADEQAAKPIDEHDATAEVDELHETPIIPATNSDTRLARNAYFS